MLVLNTGKYGPEKNSLFGHFSRSVLFKFLEFHEASFLPLSTVKVTDTFTIKIFRIKGC